MIDWQMLTLNLRQSGLSLTRASVMLGRNKGYCAQLANGFTQEPSFSDGMKLLDLHFDRCPTRHSAIKLEPQFNTKFETANSP